MTLKQSCIAALFVAASLAPASIAAALPASLSGNFTFDNDVVVFRLILPVQESLAVYTTSAATGGFPPYLVLWDNTGSQIAQFNGGEPACSDGFSVPRPGVGCNDTFVQENTLPAGTYLMGLSQAFNESNGDLVDGFGEDGIANRNFTNAAGACGAGTILFCDPLTNAPDTSNWTIGFSAAQGSVTQLTTPEPDCALTFLSGLSFAGILSRRRRRVTIL